MSWTSTPVPSIPGGPRPWSWPRSPTARQARAALAAQRDTGDRVISDRTRSLLGQLADTGLAAVSRDHLARLPEPERRAAAIEGRAPA